jgi:hypothetical protein
MFGVPLPYAALGALVLGIAVYFTGHHNGWVERDAEMQIAIAKKNDEAREIEHIMTGKINERDAKLTEANDALNQKQSALTAAIRAGRVRLPAASCVQAPASPAAASPNPEDGSESDRQTLLLIAQLAADGDKAINSLNACIDAYNTVREQINGQR